MIIFGYVVPDIVVSLVLPAIYVVGGYLQGYKMGEKPRWLELIKSIALMLVSSGVITSTQMNYGVEVLGTEVVFVYIDKFLNQVFRKYPLDLRPDAKPVIP
jgi:hypothetical protein